MYRFLILFLFFTLSCNNNIGVDKKNWIKDSFLISLGDNYYLKFGIELLRHLLKFSLDESNFPKSRNLRQLVFYLKHLIVIRELLKESQSGIPDFIDEAIFYLGKSYNLLCTNLKSGMLFNGNFEETNNEFDNYLTFYKYKFKDFLFFNTKYPPASLVSSLN